MLTGYIKPTSGRAIAHNIASGQIDLFSDSLYVADFIGLCPQQNSLLTNMTVRENLIFFCKLKGVDDLDEVVDATLQKFNLKACNSSFAKDISGGQ